MESRGVPSTGPAEFTVQGIQSGEGWREFFGHYARIALVANSSAAKDLLGSHIESNTLYIFFNEVFRVLDSPFSGDAILVSRSERRGPILAVTGKANTVLGYFTGSRFKGVVNVRAGPGEQLGSPADFPDTPSAFLDLSGYLEGFYPASHLPSTGFIMLIWLTELGLASELILVGFSAKRSERWKLAGLHDWTFEQVAINALTRAGKVHVHDGSVPRSLSMISKRFPDVTVEQVQEASYEVFSNRLDAANESIDVLYSATKPLRGAHRLSKSLRFFSRNRGR